MLFSAILGRFTRSIHRMRLILAILAITAIVMIARHLYRPTRRTPPSAKGEAMVRCATCGVHVPRSTAVHRGEQWYCSREHAEHHDD